MLSLRILACIIQIYMLYIFFYFYILKILNFRWNLIFEKKIKVVIQTQTRTRSAKIRTEPNPQGSEPNRTKWYSNIHL